jgi:hypothetical protein
VAARYSDPVVEARGPIIPPSRGAAVLHRAGTRGRRTWVVISRMESGRGLARMTTEEDERMTAHYITA